MVTIHYFVHGTTTDNTEHKSTGWKQGILSEKGIQQCYDLRTMIQPDEYDFIFTSDLQRAIDSANITFQGRNIIQDERIRECNYGDFNGVSSSLVIYEEHIKNPFPNGESLLDVEKRIHDFCDYLKREYDGKKIAIVAHKAPQLALDVIVKKISWEDSIAQDWRRTKDWKPGWTYIIQ